MKIITTGTWNGVSREIIQQNNKPDTNLVSCAFAVCINTATSEPQLILTKSHRGREHPGGGRELHETVEECLIRELHEEIAINTIETIDFIGVRKFYHTNTKEKSSKFHGKFIPETYMNLYLITTKQKPGVPLGGPEEELHEAGIFMLHDLVVEELTPGNKAILTMALEYFNTKTRNTD